MIERGNAHPPERVASVLLEIFRGIAWLPVPLSGREAQALCWAIIQCDDFLQVSHDLSLCPDPEALFALARRGVIRAQRNKSGRHVEIQLIRKLGR